MSTGGGWRWRKVPGSFSACSASVGRSRGTNACFGNRRRKMEVLPVCLAPVSTTTGRVFAERCRRGSTARVIHICIIYDIVAYYAQIELRAFRIKMHNRGNRLEAKEGPDRRWIFDCTNTKAKMLRDDLHRYVVSQHFRGYAVLAFHRGRSG